MVGVVRAASADSCALLLNKPLLDAPLPDSVQALQK
jgi:hypothetical protein